MIDKPCPFCGNPPLVYGDERICLNCLPRSAEMSSDQWNTRASKPWLPEPTCSGWWWMRHPGSGLTPKVELVTVDPHGNAELRVRCGTERVFPGIHEWQGPLEPEE